MVISEFKVIEQIRALFGTPEGVTHGIGDDGAVLEPGRFDLVTTDMMVEGVHFDRSWSSPQDIGWKLMAVNLSDVAAMGGGPGAFFLSMAFPKDEPAQTVEGILEGIKACCEALVPQSFEVKPAGGDLSATTGPMVLSITLLGESPPAGPILRSGAVPGDRVVVLGALGLSAAGLALLSGEVAPPQEPQSYDALLEAHRRPRPAVHQGAMLGLYSVPSAMLDVSDGLLQDLGHLLNASEVGASIESHSIPRHSQLRTLEHEAGVDVLPWLLGGGEDYALLMAVPPARMPKLWELARRYGWEVSDIGEIRGQDEGLRLLDAKGGRISPGHMGFDHFAGEKKGAL